MRRLFLVPFVLSLTLLAAACGGGSDNSSGGTASGDDAAVVNGDHITQATLDRRLNEAACSYKLQKKPFPKAGTTEYQQIRTQILQSLVQRAQLAQKAPSLDVSVTDKQVQAQLEEPEEPVLRRERDEVQGGAEEQCVTDAEVRDDLRSNLLSNAIFKKVTTNATVCAHRREGVLRRAPRGLHDAADARRQPHPREEQGARRQALRRSCRRGRASPRWRRSTRSTPARSRRADSSRSPAARRSRRSTGPPSRSAPASCRSRCTPSSAGTSSTPTSRRRRTSRRPSRR